MTIDELRNAAADVARNLRAAPEVPEKLRKQFLTVRRHLFERGVFDPVLVRFDSITAPRATAGELADALAAVADNLR